MDGNALIYGVGDAPKLPFVLTELLLRALTVFDLRSRPIPSDDVSLFISQRADTDEKPAILPVLAEQSCFQLVGGTAGYQTLMLAQHPVSFVQMNKFRHKVSLRMVGGKTMIVACDLIRIEPIPFRVQDKNMLRHGIDKLSQLLFTLSELVFPILLLNGYSRQMSDLPDEVLMLRGRATRFARVYREGAQYCFIG
ncbi:MAG: hypothetical protein EWM73_03345 [Nitrospira sp.]|nr:MAG: hypothetical protein EWM73_03345 [Nitrospira sp.]